jgi:gluconolactonase
MKQILLFTVISFLFLVSCREKQENQEKTINRPTIGSIEKLSDKLDQVLDPGTGIEVLAEGFEWSEGPVWIEEGKYLLFSDIPPNRIYRWSERDSLQLYLEPSGYTGEVARGGEPGSNGLLLSPEGQLVLCQHGDRRVAYMDAPLDDPKPVFMTLAGEYQGKKLNSPNDAAYKSDGSIYFTDPPYGLEKNVDDPMKEIDFQGVYRWSNGSVELLIDSLTRPNGIAFSPDESKLFVANSDPDRAIWAVYDLDAAGTITDGRIFYDVTQMVPEEKGLPDGLKVSCSGFLFATGPGGVLIFTLEGEHIGTIRTTQATANCAFNHDQTYLYITADMYLLRIPLK